MNGFAPVKTIKGQEALDLYRARFIDDTFVVNTEELASIYHLPNKSVATPNIYWVQSRKLEPPADLPTLKKHQPEDITLIGETNFRGVKKTFGIKQLDRRRHIYIIGKTGMGKSTLLENMIYSDINAGKGVGIIDPHGDLAEAVMNFIPANRTNDVILFDPSDRDFPIAFNMLEVANPALKTIVASGLVGIFKKIYSESWGPRLEHILRNTILSLLEYPNTTMLGIIRILQDRDYRRKVVNKLEDPVLKSFWINEFEAMQDKMRVEAISPIMNKVGQFLSSPIVRNIVGQPKSTVNLRFAMDKGKIIIVNLSKGRIGEDISQLLGSMLITKFQIDAMSRADVPEKERKDFYLYVDEFQNFATDSFATILSEARKYRLNLTMANQYIAQMPDEVKDAVFGNVGSIVSFQVGFDDAEYISQQYGEEAMPPDLVALSKYTAYMKLLIDGMPSRTFSLNTLPPPGIYLDDERKETIRKVVRERYSQKRVTVEDKIKRWSAPQKRELPEGARKELYQKGKKEFRSGH
ncbi:type IV secretory system conjugative DNA transfer family protein [Candidatus Peregrinibacteria bacterium]|nr:type IV secretory system conjugative DNA transfer family protein [Candidatus Peregrinibacteria bacterium]